MATSRICGWEAGDLSEAFSSSGTVSVQSSIKRGGSYALRVNPTTSATGYAVLTGLAATGAMSASALNSANSVCRFYFYAATLPASGDEMFFMVNNSGNSARRMSMVITSGGIIKLIAGDDTTVFATGSTALTTGRWYRIELYLGVGSPVPYTLKIDGATELTGTYNFIGNSNSGVYLFGKVLNRNSQSVDFFYDDVLFNDSSTFPGAGQCAILLPNGAGNYQAWTPSAGTTHYNLVDDVPNTGDTDYLTGSGTQAETEALQNIADVGISSSATINSCQPFHIARTGTALTIAVRARSGTTNSDTTGIALTATYTLYGKVLDTDPSTSAAWSASGLDGVETGAVAISGAGAGRMTLTGLMVDYTPPATTPARTFAMII